MNRREFIKSLPALSLSGCLGSEENDPRDVRFHNYDTAAHALSVRFEATESREKLFESSVSLDADESTTAEKALPRSDSGIRFYYTVDEDAEKERNLQVGFDAIDVHIQADGTFGVDTDWNGV